MRILQCDTRHLAATIMLGVGADLAIAAAQPGYTNVATAGATCAHITAGAQTRAAELTPHWDDEEQY